MSADEVVLRLRCEGKERFAVKGKIIGPEWTILSQSDSSSIDAHFENHLKNIKTLGDAYEIILNYAKSTLNGNNYELEITQIGKFNASGFDYKI